MPKHPGKKTFKNALPAPLARVPSAVRQPPRQDAEAARQYPAVPQHDARHRPAALPALEVHHLAAEPELHAARLEVLPGRRPSLCGGGGGGGGKLHCVGVCYTVMCIAVRTKITGDRNYEKLPTFFRFV